MTCHNIRSAEGLDRKGLKEEESGQIFKNTVQSAP